jgi:hypothetical protein
MFGLLSVAFAVKSPRAQTWHFNEIDEHGDTTVDTFPPPDTVYRHDRIILKFHNGSLNKDSLCFDCSSLVGLRTKLKQESPLNDSEDYQWTLGRTILVQEVRAHSGDFQVEIQNLADGFYTCRITTASDSRIAKFLVRH